MSSSIPHKKKRRNVYSNEHSPHTEISIYIFDDDDATIIAHWISFGIPWNVDFYVHLCLLYWRIDKNQPTSRSSGPEHVSNNISKLQIKKESDMEMEQKPTIIIIQCRKMCFVAVEKRWGEPNSIKINA